MLDELLRKWRYINDWYVLNFEKVYGSDYYKNNVFISNEFAGPASFEQISEIETLLDLKIPKELKYLLETHNGEIGNNNSPFFELRLLDTKEIKDQIEFGLSLVKSSDGYIKNVEASHRLVESIVAEVKSKLNLSEEWYKIDFQGGDSFRMPSIYKNKADIKGFINVRIDHLEAARLTNLLKEEEKQTYDWDTIEFTVYQDGKIETKRNLFDWNSGISGSSKDPVKPIYFHSKWIALFGDGCGNYIGIDLDPGLSGIIGQVIIYGRDVYENKKIADGLEDFFDKIIEDIKKPNNSIILKNTRYHIHERMKLLG